ncbi:hypothetical protein RB653_008455 [Dictyostelium firmibasis]|uniref:Uncharacterized protein n=1 Tax=Dictyostelium firmibasis TaxID=79012 RepID=A0AAN7YWL7_9MYCE
MNTEIDNDIDNDNLNQFIENELDRHIQNMKPLLSETNISKLIDNENIKIDKNTISFLNNITIKFTRILMMEIIESKFFEKYRNSYSYRNKSVSAKYVLETFYSLPEFENISKDMKLGEVSPTLELLYERVVRNILSKREVGSSRNYQMSNFFLEDEDKNNNNDDEENEINPMLYNNIDNGCNFLKKVINPSKSSTNTTTTTTTPSSTGLKKK